MNVHTSHMSGPGSLYTEMSQDTSPSAPAQFLRSLEALYLNIQKSPAMATWNCTPEWCLRHVGRSDQHSVFNHVVWSDRGGRGAVQQQSKHTSIRKPPSRKLNLVPWCKIAGKCPALRASPACITVFHVEPYFPTCHLKIRVAVKCRPPSQAAAPTHARSRSSTLSRLKAEGSTTARSA